MILLRIVVLAALGGVSLCLGYLYVLLLASVLGRRSEEPTNPTHRFAIAIPAHNEAAVIGATIDGLLEMDYPPRLFDIHVVSDNSSDETAEIARGRGAVCWERVDDLRRSKGHALAWLFERILSHERAYDAVVVFDADSRVDRSFLRVMDAELAGSSRALQGRHVIANPDDNWYTAAMYTSFVLDNLRNAGRSSLGLSAKLMGDGMGFAREVLERFPWTAAGLTEDAEYQATLLLQGIRVRFVPHALSYGDIPTSLNAARHQWARWMQGRSDVSRKLASRLLRAGIVNRDLAQLDGAVEQVMPSFSTLVMLWGTIVLTTAGAHCLLPGFRAPWGWLLGAGVGFALYPILGLVLARAPRATYFYLALAPFYALWRSGVRLWVVLRRGPKAWVRTPRSAADRHTR
jgi:cellulose synthase/poly-beta-1,6-N-acetylglucosamine synthase-like glycosyltransferase